MRALVVIVVAALSVSVSAEDAAFPPGWIPHPPGWMDAPVTPAAPPRAASVQRDMLGEEPVAVASGTADVASYEVRCPENATITVNGVPMLTTGAIRLFESNPAHAASAGGYIIKCRVCDSSGQCWESERRVDHRPGTRQMIDFTGDFQRPVAESGQAIAPDTFRSATGHDGGRRRPVSCEAAPPAQTVMASYAGDSVGWSRSSRRDYSAGSFAGAVG